MKNENMTPLRLGLTIMAGMLLLGVLLFRFWPQHYQVSLNASAKIASEQEGLSSADFQNIISNPDFSGFIVDIRSAEDFNTAHVERAISIPVSEILHRKNIRKLKGEKILIYGDDAVQAHQAALLLRMRGLNAEPVNISLDMAKQETGRQPALKNDEEKATIKYESLIKAFEIVEPESIEVKMPVPKPGGC
jgi:rhodanese-related sulfurtransferase